MASMPRRRCSLSSGRTGRKSTGVPLLRVLSTISLMTSLEALVFTILPFSTSAPAIVALRERSELGLDEVGPALADHHRGQVDVAPRDLGHHRSVDDIEVVEAAYPKAMIDHRHGIVGGTHP